MTTFDFNNEKYVIDKLTLIKETPPRNEEKAMSTRMRFLTELKAISEAKASARSVSIPPFQRLNEWKSNFRNIFHRKERTSMFTTLATIITVIALALGGAGATVYAAQESLPNEFLYPLKIASEDIRMQISTKSQTQFQLALEFANRRVQEIAALATDGEPIPQELLAQLQIQLQTAFQLAAGMSDSELTPALLKLRTTIREQQQIMAGISSDPNTPLINRIREMLQKQEQLCEDGLADPLMFRIRVRQQQKGVETTPGNQSTTPEPNATQGTAGQSNGISNGAGPNASPASTAQPNPSLNAPAGNGTCTDCVPVQDGTGPGPGPDASPGEGSDNSTPPQDGSGEGPGPNEDPGSGGNSNTDPGNDNQQPEEEPGSGNSNNNHTNPNNPPSPGSGGSDDGGGGKGKP